MERQQFIIKMNEFEGKSFRAIKRETGHLLKTIAKYADRENWNEEIKPRKAKGSKLDILKPTIDEWLKTDLKMPRHTGTRVYDRLRKEKDTKDLLAVGKQTVINYVTKTKKELCKSVYDTAILGEHPCGQAQVDFGEVYAFNGRDIMVSFIVIYRLFHKLSYKPPSLFHLYSGVGVITSFPESSSLSQLMIKFIHPS